MLLGANIIRGTTNLEQKRTKTNYNADYMELKPDETRGFGYNVQLRYMFSSKNLNFSKAIIKKYLSLNYNAQNYKVRIYNNQYIQNSSYYFYGLQTYNETLKKKCLETQVHFNRQRNKFFTEFSLGLGFNFPKISDNLQNLRNYNKSILDYGHVRLSPALNFRVGYLIF